MKLGTTELIVILVIVLLIFGPTQIPKLTKMFGKSVKSFKDGMNGLTETDKPDEIQSERIKNEEIKSGEGLSTLVEGHGLQSRRFRFEWHESSLGISFELPTGRVLSGDEDVKADDAEADAAIRMALVLLRAVREGKIEDAGWGRLYVACDEFGARYALFAPDGSVIEEAEGWTGLVARLEGVFGGDAVELAVIWP